MSTLLYDYYRHGFACHAAMMPSSQRQHELVVYLWDLGRTAGAHG